MFDPKSFRAPIIQYEEIIPQTWWQKVTMQKPKKRIRIKRSWPDTFNCRCSFNYIIK